jgi:hypothetical protein
VAAPLAEFAQEQLALGLEPVLALLALALVEQLSELLLRLAQLLVQLVAMLLVE